MWLAARPCWESRIISRRQAMRWGPCSRRSTSQGSWAGQEGLAYTLGGTHTLGGLVGSVVLWKASATREATSSVIGPIAHPGLRAALQAGCLVSRSWSAELSGSGMHARGP